MKYIAEGRTFRTLEEAKGYVLGKTEEYYKTELKVVWIKEGRNYYIHKLIDVNGEILEELEEEYCNSIFSDPNIEEEE